MADVLGVRSWRMFGVGNVRHCVGSHPQSGSLLGWIFRTRVNERIDLSFLLAGAIGNSNRDTPGYLWITVAFV